MKCLVTAEEMKALDQSTIEKVGIPALVLMERAALAVREKILAKFSAEASVLIAVGNGNNGADGLALGRLLVERGFRVTFLLCGDLSKTTESWKAQKQILEHYDVKFIRTLEKLEYTVVVDAVFGVGLSRPLLGEYAEIIRQLNGIKGYKVAVDMPSGIHSNTGEVMGAAFKADLTVTFAYGKLGAYLYPGCEYAGEVTVCDIGIGDRGMERFIPKYVTVSDDVSLPELLPQRSAGGNKGTFGKVLVAAGSSQMAGAAILSAKACYRIGAGMVKVVTPVENREILQTAIPEAMINCTGEIENDLEWANILAIGPGLSKDQRAKILLQRFVLESQKPILIDADGLNLLAEDTVLAKELGAQCKAGRICVITPHVGELKRLLTLCMDEVPDTAEIKRNLALYARLLTEVLHCVVVAKDARTFVCMEGKSIFVNLRGNSGMATAGSGDVLAGILAGMMAQETEIYKAVTNGVTLHAMAGDEVASQYGEHGCMAGDLIGALPKFISDYDRKEGI